MAVKGECRPGRRATVRLVVGESDTAVAMSSGDVPVLASPRVLALAEQASLTALGDCLPEEQTSVGAWAELEHVLASQVGDTVDAEAVLLGVHGRRLEFSITVRSGENEVAHVRHKRTIVERTRFDDAPRRETLVAGRGDEGRSGTGTSPETS
ncbi:MAG: thioesterase [Actinomycetota bacterium]|nr:thioesterase [Actinomycetota bacterium]